MGARLRRAVAAAAAFAVAVGAAAALRATAGAQTQLTVPAGFRIDPIAHVDGARELAVAANGDLFVGTSGSTIVLIADAQTTAAAPATFARVDDRPVAGVTIADATMYIGAQFGVYALPFHSGDRTARAKPRKIATLRPSGMAGAHKSTSVAVAGDVLYAGVGSSCNTCQPELDATRATIQAMRLDGTQMKPKAEHIRNAIALTVNPQTGSLWAGVAGQDELAHGHPYEVVDDISAHPGTVDYGWPYCYEDRRSVGPDRDCSHAVIPRVVLPAYETPVGAAFYPSETNGRFAFGPDYRDGLFVALHGSWHTPPVPPRVVFIPMRGDEPQTPVDWSNPDAQWRDFVSGFQQSDGTRIGRPTGVAVGTDGSLFVADDDSGTIYRIRPARP